MNQRSLAALLVALSIGFPISPLRAEEVDREKILTRLERDIPGLEVEETTVDGGRTETVIFQIDAEVHRSFNKLNAGDEPDLLASSVLRCLDSGIGTPHSIWIGVKFIENFSTTHAKITNSVNLLNGGLSAAYPLAAILTDPPLLLGVGLVSLGMETLFLVSNGNRQQYIYLPHSADAEEPLIVIQVSNFAWPPAIRDLREKLVARLSAEGRAFKAYPLQAIPTDSINTTKGEK